MPPASARAFLTELFQAAVVAAQPKACLAPALARIDHATDLTVLGAGKAAAQMAHAVEQLWPKPLKGLVVTRRGFDAVPPGRIEILIGDHPEPSAAGVASALRLMDAARATPPGGTVLFLLSGGASALLTVPPDGVPLADVQALNKAMLRCGAGIDEINTVRRAVSQGAGGRLAALMPGRRIITLSVSDVPGDDAAFIGSGPTVGGHTGAAEARDVLARYGVAASPALSHYLTSPEAEPLRIGDARLATSDYAIVASGRTGLEAAAQVSQAAGLQVINLGDGITGEARVLAVQIAALARGQSQPTIILSGGETSVTLGKSTGRGGRNTEFLAALALELDGAPGIHAMACDTDGIDGSEDNAGALIGPDTLSRARALKLDARALLVNHDSYSLFAALGDLVMTGPTGTNINDFRAVLVAPRHWPVGA